MQIIQPFLNCNSQGYFCRKAAIICHRLVKYEHLLQQAVIKYSYKRAANLQCLPQVLESKLMAEEPWVQNQIRCMSYHHHHHGLSYRPLVNSNFRLGLTARRAISHSWQTAMNPRKSVEMLPLSSKKSKCACWFCFLYCTTIAIQMRL